MTLPKTRLSMNTRLKNARIFDEYDPNDAWLNVSSQTLHSEVKIEDIKQELEDNEEVNRTGNKKRKQEERHEEISIKQEHIEVEQEHIEVKLEHVEVKQEHTEIKQEPVDIEIDEDTVFPCHIFGKMNIKKEAIEQYLSPVKLEMDDNTNNSIDSSSRKSAKRTVFPRESPYKTRQSPYKRSLDNDLNESSSHKTRKYSHDRPNTRPSPYKRPGDVESSQSTSLLERNETYYRNKKRYRKNVEMETDPIVLKRRQKQIDYGKNTIGYDVYTKTVPKAERSDTDPQTPDKYAKYSRRGFDGLIRQWRLKLHKYDPPEDE